MYNIIKNIVTVALCAMFCVQDVFSIFVFRNYGVSNGLSDNSVSAICQDEQGFIWLGTSNGLCRFDGSDFNIYRNLPNDSLSISNNYVSTLLEYKDGMLAGTDGGAEFFSIKKNSFSRCYQKNADGRISAHKSPVKQLISVNDKVYLLENNGRLLVMRSDLLFETCNFGNQHWLSVTAYKNQHIIAHSYAGVFLIDTHTNEIISHYQQPTILQSVQIYYSNNQNLIIVAFGLGGPTETYRIDDNNQIKKAGVSLPGDVHRSLDYEDMTLLGTNGKGLIILSQDGVITLNTQNSNISSEVVISLFKDSFNNLWVGTYRYGINLFSDNFNWFSSLNSDNKRLTDRIVTAIAIEDNLILAGLDGGGLNIYDQSTGKTTAYTTLNSALPGNNILSVINDSPNIWLGIYGKGISRFSLRDGSIKNYPLPEQATLWDIKNDGQEEIWVAGRSVYVFNKNTGRYLFIENLRNVWATDISFDKDTVWISTSFSGIYKLDRNTKSIIANYTSLSSVIPLPDNNITFIHADSNQNIWFSPRNLGLYKYNKTAKSLKFYGVQNGLTDPNVVSLLEDERGLLWVGTNNGLFRFNQLTETFIRFGIQDNLPSTQFIHNSCFRDGKTMYFGSTNGLIFFNSANIKYKQGLNPTYIQQVKILNTDQSIIIHNHNHEQVIKLPYNHNFFTISYATPEYDSPDKVLFSCRMLNFDYDWRNTGSEKEITYTNIPPGKYIFQVRQMDRNGKWSDEFASLQIVVLPPWWRTYWAMTIWGILVVCLLVFAYLLYRHDENIKQQVKIKEMEKGVEKKHNEIKLRFFTNISHEFRTPLSLIITPLEMLIKQEKDVVLRKKLLGIQKNADNLLDLVNQLLDFRKLEISGEKLNLSYGDIVEFSNSIFNSFADVVENDKKKMISASNSVHILMYFDKDKMRKIINNLLSNAFKNTNPGSQISLTVNKIEYNGKPYAELSVTDNGFGIPSDKLPYIFDRFYKLDYGLSKHSGSGIGLHLVREFVNLHEGEIMVESTLDMGSTFKVFIPLDLKPDDFENVESVLLKTETKQNKKENHKRILIVEDNDEFRQFLSEQLESEFEVFTASDGEEGEVVCNECRPHLIVTDITMPKVDGVELCKRIKNNIATSHIPVILLTARASNEFILSGYEAGADEYISKPFNYDIFLSRIKKLISQQEERENKFRKSIEIKPTDITITSLDEKLINDSLKSIEKNINNTGYSVEDLSADVGLSRTSLFRKIQSITGVTPAFFIRSIRLKRAAQLLRDSSLNISEVADYVGFGEVKYFNKHFKEEFNLTPTQYRKNNSRK